MSESVNWRFDCKQITAENWQQIDEPTAGWPPFNSLIKTESGWLEWFLRPNLDPIVPAEIAKLLEVARGAMIYGWNFYPLLTLGVEQCYRLLDCGTRARCKQAGIATKRKAKNGIEKDTSFRENTDALIKLGVISKIDEKRWNAVRNLRNLSSHPKRQSIYDPGQAQGTLTLVVEFLNNLFH